MFRRFGTAALLFALLAAVIVAVSASPALGYGKATWQTAFTGTFTYPGTRSGFGFWGWCDFSGGVTSGNGGDCQLAEYMHAPQTGPAFTCELSVDVTGWDDSGVTFDGAGSAFAITTGTAVVHPAGLTQAQKDACVEFFAGSSPSTTLSNVNTFIPAAAGHFDYGSYVSLFGAVGEFNFTVKQIP